MPRERRPAGQIVEQTPALVGVHPGLRQHLLAAAAQLVEPGLVLGPEHRRQLLPEPPGERRAVAGRGNRDLQVPALHDGGIVEVAVLRHVHGVAQYAPLAGGCRQGRQVRPAGNRGHHQQRPVKIRCLEAPRRPGETPLRRPPAHGVCGRRRHHVHGGAGIEQARRFRLPDGPRAHDKAATTIELQEQRKQRHREAQSDPHVQPPLEIVEPALLGCVETAAARRQWRPRRPAGCSRAQVAAREQTGLVAEGVYLGSWARARHGVDLPAGSCAEANPTFSPSAVTNAEI